MTLNTKALIRDVKSAFKNRTNSSSGRPSKSQSIGASKSTTDALAYRERGNRLYKEMKFQEALISFTKSVAAALEDSEELCKAYGNRSAVLFELQKYECCLLDINRALKTHCPNLVLRQKLLDRKERCLAQIKSSAACRIIDEDGTNPTPAQEPIWRADVLSKFGNSLLPNASPKIKLEYDKKWGRHFVATADINPGETLISEEYFVAATFIGEIRFKICDFCTMECHALVPCPSCASTMYCSEQCRTMAYNQYHRIECKLSVSPINNYSPLDPIPIRLFLVGTKQGAALEELMKNLSISDIFEENYNFADKPFTGDYVAALRLIVGNFNPTFSKSRIQNAVGVVTKLRTLAFFESVPDNHLRDAEVFATALLLNNCRRRHTNKFAQFNNLLGMGEGEALVLLQYMMNHSCYPNVYTVVRKRENIMFSIRPIKKNEQLFTCYHQNFQYCPKPERVQYLDFVCRCEACNGNWPPMSNSPLLPFEALLKIKEGSLPKEEGHEPLFAELLNISAPLVDDTALKNLEVREIITMIGEVISLLHKLMEPMSYPLAVFRSFLVKSGEYFYNERERDLSLNGKLSFPFLKDARDLEYELQSFLPADAYHRKAIIRIFCVIHRLSFYLGHGHFINKNIIG